MAKKEAEKKEEAPPVNFIDKNFYFIISGIVAFSVFVSLAVYLLFSKEEVKTEVVVEDKDIIIYDEDQVLTGAVFRLPKLLINLKKNSGVLEVKVTLGLFDLELPEDIKNYEAFYTDKIISISSNYEAEQLLKSKTKGYLKNKLIESFNQENKPKIVELYFEEFNIRNY